MGFSPVQLSLSGEKLGKEALVRFDCHCHRLSIGYSKPQRTYCCKRCGMPLSYEMISFNPVVQDRSGAQDAEQDLSEALSRIDSLGADLYATRQRIGDLEAAVSDRDAEVLRLKQQLQEAEQESSRRISEAESEKANLSAIADNLVASRNSLQRDLDDLNATNAHLRRECDDLRSIPVRQSTEAFLEFMSAVYNASFDKKSFESLAKGL